MKIEKFKIFENQKLLYKNVTFKEYYDVTDKLWSLRKDLNYQLNREVELNDHIRSKISEWYIINKEYIFNNYNMAYTNSSTNISWWRCADDYFKIGFTNNVILNLKVVDIEDLMLYIDDNEQYKDIKSYNL